MVKANHRNTFQAFIPIISDNIPWVKVRKMVKSKIKVWEVHSMYLKGWVV